MEIIIHWFWLVNVLLGLILITMFYIAIYKKKGKSFLFNILLVISIIFSIVSPIKIKNIEQSNYTNIEQSFNKKRELPKKIIDDSFQKHNKINGIQPKDLK